MKNTFLYGDLEEEIYIKILIGFTREKGENKMCR